MVIRLFKYLYDVDWKKAFFLILMTGFSVKIDSYCSCYICLARLFVLLVYLRLLVMAFLFHHTMIVMSMVSNEDTSLLVMIVPTTLMLILDFLI